MSAIESREFQRKAIKGTVFGECIQCGRKFIPRWMDCLDMFSRTCPTCGIKNLEKAFREAEEESK